MHKEELLALAKNPDFISGIYNYCDRWCERCPLTARCFLYATEEADADLSDPEVHDINNEKFWKKLRSIFESTAEMLREWAEEAGVDLDSSLAQAMEKNEQERQRVEQDELAQVAHDYALAVEDWFKTEMKARVAVYDERQVFAQDESDLGVSDAVEVIRWYQFFVAVKVHRALSGIDGIDEEAFDDEEILSFDFSSDDDADELDHEAILARSSLIDSNGSAKIALVAIDRSIGAWRALQISRPDKSQTIKPLLLQLERLRRSLETRFPRARDFVRPGFDEHLSEFVS
ncbi:MAG TPA: hypothetical protein VNG71_05595 [Pyrinomonadaceae bacterium]|nr:hypothetical protein [Pyrinomonadaceae bacterium]